MLKYIDTLQYFMIAQESENTNFHCDPEKCRDDIFFNREVCSHNELH